MPAQKKMTEQSYRRNPTPKASRRSAQTIANKAREAEKRTKRFQRKETNRRVMVLSWLGNDGDFKALRGKARRDYIRAAENAQATLEKIAKKRATRDRAREAKQSVSKPRKKAA